MSKNARATLRPMLRTRYFFTSYRFLPHFGGWHCKRV